MSSSIITKTRKKNKAIELSLIECGINKNLASILSARDIRSVNDLNYELNKLLPFQDLHSIELAADFLLDFVINKKKILIIGDYDADGATASACAVRGLTAFGANVDFLVPNRFEYGYGLTPEIVDLALTKSPELIITVDNGIASYEGVKKARDYGIQVIVTDHHLPGEFLPDANFIINPNQSDCNFKSKHLCGVGVIFYLLMALKSKAKAQKIFDENNEPKLSQLLDLVCLGTIADLVKLDFNNRLLVEFGMQIIRSGKGNHGIRAIAHLSNRELHKLKTSDLSFAVAPKLNAAGRLEDMTLGIRCLLAESFEEALELARQLINLNDKRREIEREMKEDALQMTLEVPLQDSFSISLFNEKWHQGVIGILASRIKEQYHRPTFIFAKDDSGRLKGSGRSIANLHLRDALDLVSKKHKDLLIAFGGHAMAAGVTIEAHNFSKFEKAFESVAHMLLTPNDLNQELEIDESLLNQISIDDIDLINKQIWGQGFTQPIFKDSFELLHQKVVANKHLKCFLKLGERDFEAIYFNHDTLLPDKIEVVYGVDVNDFHGQRNIQLTIRQLINE